MSKKIFVGNLPYETNANELSAWFQRNGFPADAVNLSVDRLSGHPRGFGFVEINESLASRCVSACNGQDFLGRTLIVNEELPGLSQRRLARQRG